ncbi:uncharacterized protein [Fopius arisanus]|uniref:ZNF532 protein n=1 Tax=Fopius arisanus TaxID=64838 RepID=A0A0C9RZA8_9HYME|nr:PREDICTED: uncharacterized protein LOC105270097 [Fopius arisanus]
MYTSDQSQPGGNSRGKSTALPNTPNEKSELPKLRKNRRHELRWGPQYFTAIKDIVFTIDPKPYVAPEIPKELRIPNEPEHSLHTCKYCNDSYRFKSSLDEHENRKVFVLGYWCIHCFSVNCTHTKEDRSMCLLCQNIENKNRARLNRRGLKRGQRMGSVKIFYNQCQLFAHLKLHDVYTVDMAYLMLMPMPSDVEKTEWAHLHDACKALMEYAFVKQKHVLDILRAGNHTGKWWMSEPSDSSLIGELMKKYLIDSCDEWKEASDNSSDGTPMPREDSPIPTDITFVDCGPTPSVYMPVQTKTNATTTVGQISLLKSPPAIFSQVPSLDTLKKKISVPRLNRRERQSSKQQQVGKKAVIKKGGITSTLERGTAHLVEKCPPSIAGKSGMRKTVATPSISAPVLLHVSNSPENLSNISGGGKLVIQNGRKYIIRQIPSANFVASNEGKVRGKVIDNTGGAQNPPSNYQQARIPQLLSPALKNRKIHLPRNCLASDFENNANLHCLDNGPKGMEILLRKYRLDMRKKLLTYPKQKIQTIIKNVSEFCSEFTKSGCVDSSAILKRNLATLKSLTGYLETAEEDKVLAVEMKINQEFKNKLTTWEYQKNCVVCLECKKKRKPKEYLPGISKVTVQEEDYCLCANFICHLCKAKQGSENQFKEHLKFHNNQSPYTCPECFSHFSNMQNLEIHIWTKCFHLNTQVIFACKVCEMEGFLTMEALSRHYYEVHTRSVIVCPECPTASSSYYEHVLHYSKDHTGGSQEPDALIICDFGGCLVSPQNFMLHLENHREIGRIQYYTCPFCAFFIKNVSGNENIIQDHVFMNHRERLCEVISPETLNFFARHFNLTIENEMTKSATAKGKEIVLPKIVNSCSIAETAFESHDETKSQQIVSSTVIKLSKLSDSQKASSGVTIPKIVKVQSMNPGANEAADPLSSQSSNAAANKTVDVLNNQKSLKIQTLRGGKFVSIPVNYVTTNVTPQHRPIMVKMNLFDKNSNQLDGKKILSHTSNSAISVPTNSTSSVLNTLDHVINPTWSNNPLTDLKQSNEASQDNFSIIPDEPRANFEIEDLVESSVDESEGKILDSSELIRDADEVLKRKGKPNKPWRIALDGSEDSNTQPLNFKCHLCYENITTAYEVIKHHFATKHFREYKLCEVSPRLEKITSSAESDTKVECKKRKSEPSSPRGASRRKRRGGLTKSEDNSRSGICVTQEKLEQVEGNFKCKKCEELFEDVKKLREHFADRHRIKGHFLVCLECGENFVVANSLQMHLKAFHGIIDTVSYLAQNSLYAPDIGGSYDARTTEPNQCYVCMAVFEDKSAVDKHLRVHGMAFLNHTRTEARNALKTDNRKSDGSDKPEVKRINIEHNGDNESHDGSFLSRISMLLS